MRNGLLILVSLAFAAATSVQAQRGAAQIRFQTMDKNGDHEISRAEWVGSARSFQVHDWNGDGKLSGDELRIGAQRNTQWDQVDHAPNSLERNLTWTAAGFRNLDHNHDGRIARNEWHYDLETFRRVDRNGDEALTEAEFLGSNDWDDDRGDEFDDLDINNNGRVERSEWHAGTNVFAALDRNRDGVLSRSEVVGGTEWSETGYDEFASLDVDRNGSIDAGEWHWARGGFDRLDANRDGRLSRREFETAADAPTRPGAAAAMTKTVDVNPQQRWTDTGLDVRAGDTIAVDASGTIKMSANVNDVASPAGSREGRTAPAAPILNQLAGALIARVGDYSPIFVGDRRTMRVPVSGRLYLGVNDDDLGDNSGAFKVTVTRQGQGMPR